MIINEMFRPSTHYKCEYNIGNVFRDHVVENIMTRDLLNQWIVHNYSIYELFRDDVRYYNTFENNW